MQNWIFISITPVFSVAWSYINHYNMLIYYQRYKQCLMFLLVEEVVLLLLLLLLFNKINAGLMSIIHFFQKH